MDACFIWIIRLHSIRLHSHMKRMISKSVGVILARHICFILCGKTYPKTVDETHTKKRFNCADHWASVYICEIVKNQYAGSPTRCSILWLCNHVRKYTYMFENTIWLRIIPTHARKPLAVKMVNISIMGTTKGIAGSIFKRFQVYICASHKLASFESLIYIETKHIYIYIYVR